MPNVTFEKENKTVVCSAGTNLRQLARANGVELYSGIWKALHCRGNGLCAKCEVEIPIATNLGARSGMEEIQLKGRPLIRRLACQVTVHGDMSVRSHPPAWKPEKPAKKSD
ncbi:MAG TPA: 2Fe-2S iron-sulfur cluster binding domain-containing protein [bacterium]|nr:2Fe-2S iron-sulfur cluster binding domain-containing protein [bacterium]